MIIKDGSEMSLTMRCADYKSILRRNLDVGEIRILRETPSSPRFHGTAQHHLFLAL